MTPARAQAPGRNPAAAEALYDEARRLVDAGRFAEACPKFKESYQLDPGGGTLLNLADCYEKAGKTALAWSTFKEALVVAQRDGREDRVQFANAHLGPIEAKMARLTVLVPAQGRAAGLTVTVDGATLGEPAWGLAMPVDPGTHVVSASAPGKRAFSTSVDVSSAPGLRVSVDVPALADAPGGVAEGGTAGAAAGGGSGARRTLGWVLGGVGIAGLGVGSYFGVRAYSRWSDRNGACPNGVCTVDARAAGDDAKSAATISTVAFAAGGAGVVAGVILLLTSSGYRPAGAASAARVTVLPEAIAGGAGLSMGGAW
ncbi:MAG: hypothetical protein JOZ69_21915 [Myxococcales bacterium]|nr:hypothetical protein [Myxococcales bacterium]